jgi:hypothetical protein
MFNNKNLLSIRASAKNKYITQVMRNLFTKEELETGYIIEGKSTSKRMPLNLEKISLLKGIYYYLIC